MLVPAIIYKDEICKAVMKYKYTDDMIYYTGCLGDSTLMIDNEDDGSLYQYAIIDNDRLIGYLTIIAIITGVLILLVELVKFGLENLKRIYKYKHRFDKKPTAKCYCIDCKYHDNFVGSCFGFDKNQHTADNWFCWKASPRKDEILNNSVNEEEHNV